MRPAWKAVTNNSSTFFKPDVLHSKFVLYIGAYPGFSGKPMQLIGRKTVEAVVNRDLKFAVIDPVMSSGALGPGNKTEWVPIKPTTDGALIMALIRWMFENQKINETYLEATTLESAQMLGYNSYTNSSYLVITDPDHSNYRKMLRPVDLGWDSLEEGFMVIDKASGKPMLSSKAVAGNLNFEGVIESQDGQKIKVTTSLNMLKNNAFKYSLDEYSQACGVPKEKISELAREFTSHGYRVGVDGMGNLVAANGYYTGIGLYLLSALVGSWNMKGGMQQTPESHATFARGPRYNLSTVEGAPRRLGVPLCRSLMPYEYTSEYKEKLQKGENPYPARLPWYPLASNIDNQAVYSMMNGYPYKPKILMNWMANLFFSTPGAAKEEIVELFKNPDTVPLIISVDSDMREVSHIADYVIPDTTPYESWGLVEVYGYTGITTTTVRWPVVKPAIEEINSNRFPSFENYVIDVAKRLELPGFGEGAIKDYLDNEYPLNNPEDYFLKAVVNTAYDEEPVPDINEKELKLQELDNLSFNVESVIKSEEWKKAAYVLSRGGRFEPYNSDWDGERQKHSYLDLITIYNEKLATTRNSMNGSFFEGTAYWLPEEFANGSSVDSAFTDKEWPFKIINCKTKLRSVAILSNAPVLTDLSPKNYIEVNVIDAASLNLKTGDNVKLISATGGAVVGELLARQGIAQGTVVVGFGYGAWASGAQGYRIGKEKIVGDKNRAGGIMAGKVSTLDVNFDGIFGLSDLSVGVPARNGGRYKIERV